MKKQVIIILIVFIVLIGIFIFIFNNNQTHENESYQNELENCMNIPLSGDGYEGFLCISNLAYTLNEKAICEKIKDYAQNEYTETNYNNCIKNLFYLTEVRNKCSKDVINEFYFDPECVTSLAIEYKNDAICNHIRKTGVARSECYFEAYVAIGDIEKCDMLKTGSFICKELISGPVAAVIYK